MAIKMIVTDLDGTFYHRDLTFNRTWFNELYAKMKEQHIQFVVASGNQYYQLISFFDQRDEMSFVAENGGYIVDKCKELYANNIPKDICHKVLDVVSRYPEIFVNIVCGKKCAYANKNISDNDFNEILNYFPKMIKVENQYEIEDQIMKFALMCPENFTDTVAASLNDVIDDSLAVVTSGHGCIDIIVKGIHKGFAISKLLDIYNIHPDEVMAFGDARNDLELLELAGYGFVMCNGTQYMKEKIKRVTPLTNEQDGELAIIQEYFDNPKLFLEKYKI